MNFRIITQLYLIFALSIGITTGLHAQKKKKDKKEQKTEKPAHYLDEVSVSGLKFRSVGPALTSGRISDFAIHPTKPSTYYIATSSGGVWKTTNAGTTYQPIFDSQGSYSIGVVTIDPNNPNTVWVGTGENNNQRSVAYGDGIYKSLDGGKSWKHMGLKESEHIGSIVVDPRNSNIVYVAAIGPLWSKGGDRGVYKTTDGGENWEPVLTVSEHTGINEIVMDPRNPDILYASALQRRRHVFTYLGGGPESGLYKSTDGGKNWKEINKGLPGVDLGRIGLAISPANPDILYAIVEAAQGKSGFYKSTNGGASWQKQSSYVTSGNYYQELVADPVDPHKIYAMDTWMHYSDDGGKSFKMVGEVTKHVDNHCMWIDPNNTDHWLVGCDGGVYETWDAAKTWDFKKNLPVTQFYKIEVDNSEPFYYIYGGTQDNFSMGGPSRTISGNGIVNEDWFITHGGDGFETQIDPKNTNIVYAQSQYGGLARYDKRSGEEVSIKPQPRKGENAYRWNWDAPLAVSTHKDGRIYFAANKLFQSDDRGNSWEVISNDLTRQINRNELEIMGRVWSIDAVNKNRSTSPYGTIVAFSESPLNEDLLYVGTDDGLIQRTENGGDDWFPIDNIYGVPKNTYVNMVLASQHDENTVYACFNHHKYGDFRPYFFKSTNKGLSWSPIHMDLPERGSAYCIAEDHEDPNLLFVGTEFGVFFTNNGGQNWKQIKAGVPTVAVRDIAIQKRENDLVLGTFGRGFYVLDDYSPLRDLGKENFENEAYLFTSRDALLFEYKYPLGLPEKSFQGDNYYTGENLGSEALITFYLRDDIETKKDERRKEENEIAKEGGDHEYPTYAEWKEEQEQINPEIIVMIEDENGKVVKKMTTSPQKGIHRMKWDMRYPSKRPISLSSSSFYNPWASKDEGTLVEPGTYSVSIIKQVNGEYSQIAGPSNLEIIPLNNTTIPAKDREEKVAFQRDVAELSKSFSGAQRNLSEISTEIRYFKKAIQRLEKPMEDYMKEVYQIEDKLRDIQKQLNGDPYAGKLDMNVPPSVSSRIGTVMYGQFYSTAPPTETHKQQYAIAKEEFPAILKQINQLRSEVDAFRDKLEDAGAPYTPGQKIELGDN